MTNRPERYLINGNACIRSANSAKLRRIGGKSNVYMNSFCPHVTENVAETVAYCLSTGLD